MLDLLIGIPTYRDFQRIDYLLSGIFDITDFSGIDYGVVILDDGTPDKNILSNLTDVANEYNVELIRHPYNMGIPKSWNDLTTARQSKHIVLFNDDIGIIDKNWAKCFLFFVEQNEKMGMVGFPLIHIDPATGQPHEERNKGGKIVEKDGCYKDAVLTDPGRCGAAVGCSFGFSREMFDVVGGFWNELVSFHEESDFGFQGSSEGYYSYMMSYPNVEHRGSQTFANNRELSLRKIDDNVLAKEEYLKIITPFIGRKNLDSINRFYSIADAPSLSDYKTVKPDPGGDWVGRMEYSRAMFAKKWGVVDKYPNPLQAVHNRLLDGVEPRKIKWLDDKMEVRETLV